MVRKALVVDDDQMMMYLLEYALGINSYAITWATAADQALRILEGEEFDLVVTDLCLGQPCGLDVIRKIKENNPKTITIMISGCSEPSREFQALLYGADDFLFKPFSLGEFLERVQLQEVRRLSSSSSPMQKEQQAGNLSG
jgi:DNA-binding response OmpR family regulator